MEVEKPWRIVIYLQILWLRESLKEITKRHLVYCERGLFHHYKASYLDPYGAPHKEAYSPTDNTYFFFQMHSLLSFFNPKKANENHIKRFSHSSIIYRFDLVLILPKIVVLKNAH